jgi:hypothetical protein
MSHRVVSLGLLITLVVGAAGAQVVLAPTRYELTIDVDYAAEVLRGAARVTLENPSSKPVAQASMLLYRLMKVKSANVPFTQTVVIFDDAPKLQVNQIVFTLPQPLAPNARTTIEMQYDGPLVGYAETGMLYVKDRVDPDFTIVRMDAYAYPQPGFPSRAINHGFPLRNYTYTARITVPKELVVANGGHLDQLDTVGERATYTFSSIKPSWRMDFAIAKYAEISSGPIRIYYLPGDKAGAESVAAAARKSMDLFTSWFGPLPGPSALTFIEIPEGFGSQADVTTVIQRASGFKDPKKLHEVYHEISHLWNVPDTDLPSPRWNEGLASFLEDLVDQEVTGQPLVDKGTSWTVNRLRTEMPKHPEWKKTPLVDYGRAQMTGMSYSVGNIFFDLLYRLAGRETFNKIIAESVARGSGTTNDLMAIVRKRGGAAVAPLVDDFIYTTRWTERLEQAKDIKELEALYRR